ncbi:hypothetical protein [Haloarcula sp. CBA1127]|uniref:hypothetical protein n=1 Tax=Haloarcula sp. CBA1127 TaxID=1765055 RepID=UPI00073EF642|nr:hypothetical protein [Haloarcula sp. CBA1127]
MALTYLGRIPMDELCDAFEDPDHRLNDWLDEHGIDYNAKDIGCATISIGTVGASPQVAVVVAGLCAGPVLGCVANDAIRENTPCGVQYVGVYLTDTKISETKYPISFRVECEGIDSTEEAKEVAKEMSQSLEDAADSADYAVEVGQDVVDEIEDTLEDGVDEIGDIINMGQDFVLQ